MGIQRILKTLRVHKNNIVIERKGIYAIENYIISRRLMFMQVYLHKTVLSADSLIRSIFKRVSYLFTQGKLLPSGSTQLDYFLREQPSAKKNISSSVIDAYAQLDDYDVYQSIKAWQSSKDPILSDLSDRFLNRNLFRASFYERKPGKSTHQKIQELTRSYLDKNGLPSDEESLKYYIRTEYSTSEAYKYKNDSIWILDNEVAIEFSKAADTKNIIALTEPVKKYFIIHPKY